MKKILTMSLILVVTIICMMGSTYAALSCNVSVQASKTEVSKNEEFTVNVNISNIQSERGIISMGGTLEYDKDSLELLKIEGKNGWETPTNESSYNANNGKIAITRSGLGKNAETVFTITFKVKEESNQNLMVSLRNITVADGTKPAKIAQAYQNITVSEGTPNPVPQPKPDDTTDVNPGNNGNNSNGTAGSNSTGNSSLNGNTSKNTVNKVAVTNRALPKAGDNSMIIVAFVAVLTVTAIIFFVKMRLVHKEMR